LASSVGQAPDIDGEEALPLLVLYGSNSGSCEAFAHRLAGEAADQGYVATLATLDQGLDCLPTEGAVVILTASYEGHPTDNARKFVHWLRGTAPDSLTGLRYAVFGCGNRQWARTYQAIPKEIDGRMEAAGARRFKVRGEADASGDFFGGFDDWATDFWTSLSTALGRQVRAVSSQAGSLELEICTDARADVLRQGGMFHGEVLANHELVNMNSVKGREMGRSKRHVEILLPQGMRYHAGDYLALLPMNPPKVVERALRRFGFAPERGAGATSLPTDDPVTVADLLGGYVELSQPATRSQVAQLVASSRCPPEQHALQQIAEEAHYVSEVLGRRLSVLDLLERFASCELSFASFLAMLPPLKARQYSISSSPLWDAKRCSLTVAVVDAPALSGQGRYEGVASTQLARAEPGTRLQVTVRPSKGHFHLPASPLTPLVMVCAGTGLAPFRGFIQERAVQAQNGQAVGPALLFFGCDHPDVDLIYRDELAAWEALGVVSLRPAFSAAPVGEVSFVQHRVWQDRDDVATLFRQGAHVYVCGDGRYMAPAVRETFVRIYAQAKGATPDAANKWADRIERETGRYVEDVFS
jgi:cytochrome P450 / NADPH-cytochrome P450 reductase